MIWPYCVSNGYVISSDLLAPLVLASRHYNAIYYNEEMKHLVIIMLYIIMKK